MLKFPIESCDKLSVCAELDESRYESGLQNESNRLETLATVYTRWKLG